MHDGFRPRDGGGSYEQPAEYTPPLAQANSIGGASEEITCPGGSGLDPEVTEQCANMPEQHAAVREYQPPTIISTTIVHPDGRIEPIPMTKDLEDFIIARHVEARAHIMHSFGETQSSDLNTERGDRFLESLGIAATSHTVEVDELQNDKLMNYLQKQGMMAPKEATTLQNYLAYYLPSLDTSVTVRNKRFEELNGPVASEVSRIHEQVHSGATRHWDVSIHEGDKINLKPVTGFEYYFREHSGESGGKFLMEGLAEYIAGKYVAEVLGMPHGLTNTPGSMYLLRGEEGNMEVPSRYVAYSQQGMRTIVPAGYAAVAVHHVIDKDPGLLPAMIAGQSSSEGFTETIDRLEAIRPGLSILMGYHFNDDTLFRTGLRRVRTVLGISLQNAPIRTRRR